MARSTQKIASLFHYYYSGGSQSTDLSIAESTQTLYLGLDWRSRVPNGRHEQPSVEHDSVTGRTFLYSAYKWDTKYRGLGAFTFYDPNNGFYPALIDISDYADNADNHLTTTGITVGDYHYMFRERDHKQEMEVWKMPANDYSQSVLVATHAPHNARATLIPFNGNILMFYQRTVDLVPSGQEDRVSVVEFDTSTDTFGTIKDLFLPDQTGIRIYVSRPHGSYLDADGWFYIVPQKSTSGGHNEYFVMKSQDNITFYNLAETHSYTFNDSNDAIAINVLESNGYRTFGATNPSVSLPNHTTCLGDDEICRALFHDERDNTLYFKYHTGTAWSDAEILTLPNGLVPRPERIDYNYTSINNNGGNCQIVIPGVDVSWDFLVGSDDYFDEAGAATEILAVEYSGGDTLVTFDLPFSSTNTGTVRSVWPDDSCVLWMQHKNGSTYFTIMVQDGVYKKWHLYKKTGAAIEDIGDVFEDINENIHKCSGPVNEIPDNVNFAFFGSKYTYLGDSASAQTGTVYTKVACFGTVATEVQSYPSTAYADRTAELNDIAWLARYAFDDVAESGGTISQLNDLSGNGRHATAQGTQCLLVDNAIKTYGSSYFSLASFADFRTNTAFTLFAVVKKIGNSYLISAGDAADQYDYVGLATVSGKSVGYEYGLTSIDVDTIQASQQTIGDEYNIVVITGDIKHIRFYINGLEVNKIFSASVISNMMRWFNGYNTALDNLLIGAKITTAATYTPIDFKEWGYLDSVITYQQRYQLENYIASTHGITLRQFGQATTYEPEVEVTIDRMSSAPTSQQATDLNDLIVSIKNSQGLAIGEHSLGVKFNMLNIRASHSQDAALKNFARPKFDTTAVNSPTFTQDRGFASNGTTSYLNTNHNTSLHAVSLNSNVKFGGYVITDVTRGNKSIMGSSVGTNISARIFPRNSSDNTSAVCTATTAITIGSITDMRGFYSAWRVGTTRYVQRETTEANSVTSASSYNNASMFELAENDDGVAAFFLDATVAFTFFGNNSIDEDALRTAVRNWLVNTKGVTGI